MKKRQYLKLIKQIDEGRPMSRARKRARMKWMNRVLSYVVVNDLTVTGFNPLLITNLREIGIDESSVHFIKRIRVNWSLVIHD